MAQTKAIKAQNNEIYNFIKTETSIQCINYSDKLSLSFERRTNTKKLNVCFINMDMSVVPTSYIVSCHAWLKTCDIYAQTMLTQ